ncbi:endolytic transglycosylase MltG, partial [Stenotrophomonas sp. 3diitr2024]|uniref:endolytic transglycosylase MltG n=1 Tax=Stenotrophomonas sp. 3diitr2024 TaxID=3345115 RepID=UPI0035CABA8C
LKIGMRLQTDPTVIYGLGAAYDGNIRRRDLTTDTPYNTYFLRAALNAQRKARGEDELDSMQFLKLVRQKLAVPGIVFGAVGTAGQRCTTTRRLIVHRSIYADVLATL